MRNSQIDLWHIRTTGMKAATFRRRPSIRGFSAPELLGVVGVITILALLMMAWASSAFRKSRMISCQSNLKQIGLAMCLYADDYSGRMPHSADCLVQLAASYVRNWQIIRCPADAEPNVIEYEGTRYEVSYFFAHGVATDDLPSTIIAGDDEARHGGMGNVVCLDGRVKPLPSRQLEACTSANSGSSGTTPNQHRSDRDPPGIRSKGITDNEKHARRVHPH